LKILIISSRLPRAKGKADSITVYRIIKHLSQRHDIYLACFYSGTSESQYIPELKNLCVEVKCIKHNFYAAATRMFKSLLFDSHMPLQVAFYNSAKMKIIIKEMLNRIKPDITYSHLIRMAEYIKNDNRVPKILAMQISQTLNYGRMIKNIGSTFHRILYSIEYNRVLRYEPEITNHYDSCLLISKHDKESLKNHESIQNIFFSPHGVDVDYYTKKSSPKQENAVLFCGVMETPTNVDAALFFYAEIFPRIKNHIPDIKLYFVGKNPPSVILKIADKDNSVIATGFVEDIRPYYEKIKVGIDPLRIGAGLQNKLLVGMSMGQPMVCTSIANEGIGATAGEHLLVADDPEDFARAVVCLLTDAKYASELSNSARRFVETNWTWESHFEDLESHLISVEKKIS
jgi:polysaccharide biosynthesis protein PslH